MLRFTCSFKRLVVTPYSLARSASISTGMLRSIKIGMGCDSVIICVDFQIGGRVHNLDLRSSIKSVVSFRLLTADCAEERRLLEE